MGEIGLPCHWLDCIERTSMDYDEFAALSLEQKWTHLKEIMDYISNIESKYSMRQRFNPHHPKKQQKEEERRVRLDQWQRWQQCKDMYAGHRDELANTLDNPSYEECKRVIEKIFTDELDDALRNVIE